MTPLTRQGATAIAAICVLFGLYGWATFLTTFGHDGVIAPRYNAPGTDWIVFYSAAKAYFAGNLPLVFDGDRFTAYQNAAFADWLSVPMPFHPWLYPPPFLLLVLPFAALPFALSYAVFMAFSLAALLAAAWRYVEPGERRFQMVALLVCPAASLTVIAGQNAFLSGALLLGGFAALPRRPILGGALLGVLCFKPTLWLMVPVALVASRQWRALAAAVATALVLTLASLAVIGVEAWQQWLELTLRPPADFYNAWLESGRSWGLSVYTCAILLGLPHATANLIQGIATCSAAAVVFWTFRRPLPADRQLILLLAATILAAPHVSGYDTLLLAIAAGIFVRRALAGQLLLYQVAVMLAAWLLPLINPPRATPLGFATPLVVVLVMACALVRTSAKAPLGAVAAA